jgi:predicted transcriptional regulator
MKSISTSIRIKPHLRQELQSLSAHSGQGMNRIMEQALEEYLKRYQKTLLIDEAMKDIVFLRKDKDEDTFWDQAYDDTGWIS